MAFFAPGFGLGAPSKLSIDYKIFQWKCPLQNEIALPFQNEIPGLKCGLSNVKYSVTIANIEVINLNKYIYTCISEK